MEEMDGVSNEGPSKAVLRAVEAVQANIDTVVESMMEAYRAHIPSYAAATNDLLVDVRAGARPPKRKETPQPACAPHLAA